MTSLNHTRRITFAAMGVLAIASLAAGCGEGADTMPGTQSGDATASTDGKADSGRRSRTRHCGGFAGLTCHANEFCDYTQAAQCGAGDQLGTCKALPQVCPHLVNPVCGCDGRTYNNSCEANRAGTSVASDGPCQ